MYEGGSVFNKSSGVAKLRGGEGAIATAQLRNFATSRPPMNYSFIRYLEAKQTVDDRALNQRVWQTFWESLPGSSRQYPLEMLELGAGTGAMTKRIIDSSKISTLMYTAIDDQPENIEFLQKRSAGWLEKRPFINLFAEVNTVEKFVAEKKGEHYFDAILAHAFLDLTDLDDFLPQLLELLPDGGIGYFTINFDGDTIFQPPHPADELIVNAYHGSMRDPHSGRRLLQKLIELGVEILAAGSSDWVVYPSNKKYPVDEGYFLHHILSFFEESLSSRDDVDRELLNDWLKARHAQVESGDLIYIAHQLDIVFRKKPSMQSFFEDVPLMSEDFMQERDQGEQQNREDLFD